MLNLVLWVINIIGLWIEESYCKKLVSFLDGDVDGIGLFFLYIWFLVMVRLVRVIVLVEIFLEGRRYWL